MLNSRQFLRDLVEDRVNHFFVLGFSPVKWPSETEGKSRTPLYITDSWRLTGSIVLVMTQQANLDASPGWPKLWVSSLGESFMLATTLRRQIFCLTTT